MNESIERLFAPLSREEVEDLLKQVRQRTASGSSSLAERGVKMRIRVTAGKSLRASRRSKAPPLPQDEPTVRALARLSPALRAAFVKAEPKVLAWLRSSHENRTRFLLDPVSALKEAVADFDERLIGEIKNLRAASARAVPDIPGLKVDSFELEVAGADQEEKR